MTRQARKAARKIVADLSGRADLDHAWYRIDAETKAEILNEWTRLIDLAFVEDAEGR